METLVIDPEVGSEPKNPIEAGWEFDGTETMISTAREYHVGSRFGRVAMLIFLAAIGLIPFLAEDRPSFPFCLFWESRLSNR